MSNGVICCARGLKVAAVMKTDEATRHTEKVENVSPTIISILLIWIIARIISFILDERTREGVHLASYLFSESVPMCCTYQADNMYFWKRQITALSHTLQKLSPNITALMRRKYCHLYCKVKKTEAQRGWATCLMPHCKYDTKSGFEYRPMMPRLWSFCFAMLPGHFPAWNTLVGPWKWVSCSFCL